MMSFYAPLVCKNNGFLAINFHIFDSLPQPLPNLKGSILMRASHPENFIPHQYDGYTPEMREVIRKENPEIPS